MRSVIPRVDCEKIHISVSKVNRKVKASLIYVKSTTWIDR
jgi:hypothetical protein